MRILLSLRKRKKMVEGSEQSPTFPFARAQRARLEIVFYNAYS